MDLAIALLACGAKSNTSRTRQEITRGAGGGVLGNADRIAGEHGRVHTRRPVRGDDKDCNAFALIGAHKCRRFGSARSTASREVSRSSPRSQHRWRVAGRSRRPDATSGSSQIPVRRAPDRCLPRVQTRWYRPTSCTRLDGDKPTLRRARAHVTDFGSRTSRPQRYGIGRATPSAHQLIRGHDRRPSADALQALLVSGLG